MGNSKDKLKDMDLSLEFPSYITFFTDFRHYQEMDLPNSWDKKILIPEEFFDTKVKISIFNKKIYKICQTFECDICLSSAKTFLTSGLSLWYISSSLPFFVVIL